MVWIYYEVAFGNWLDKLVASIFEENVTLSTVMYEQKSK